VSSMRTTTRLCLRTVATRCGDSTTQMRRWRPWRGSSAAARRKSRSWRRTRPATWPCSSSSRVEALVPALDIVELGGATGLDVAAAAEVYFALGERLELDWLRDQIVALPRDTHWDAMVRAAL